MAYQGSTSATPNVPVNLARGWGAQNSTGGNLFYSTAATSYAALTGGTGLWLYQSTDPTSTIVGTVTYFTDGLQLGMRNGDICFCLSVTSAGSTSSFLMGIGALFSTNSTAGFSVATGSIMYSTA